MEKITNINKLKELRLSIIKKREEEKKISCNFFWNLRPGTGLRKDNKRISECN